ncbi:MAG: phage terminase large subunit family protein [Roseibium sp.]|nr:phage terminase large subunit family protein [Roseibium sp.]
MPSEIQSLGISPKADKLFERASLLLKSTPRTTSDEWGRNNRVYPPTSGHPGPRNPNLTPYTIPFARAVDERKGKRVVLVMFAQGGKSDTLLDIIGKTWDTAPVPMLYLGPTKQFLTEQWEPRIDDLLTGTPALKKKVGRKKRMTKTKKLVAGVPLRLAHGGSSTALKSDPFGLAFTDEADDLMANVKGAGNPLRLVDKRGETYADFCHAIVSTPSIGPSEIDIDEDSGLAFWAEHDPKEIQSIVWKLWQSGTRYHWAWPCPHCSEYFIPRFSCLKWDKPKDEMGKDLPSDPMLAMKTAHLQCPCCGMPIHQNDVDAQGSNRSNKEWMNDHGVYVAPGQRVEPDGTVVGPPPESWTISFWVSGLASPFVSWGARAAEFVDTIRSGDSDEKQAVMNGSFGELYVHGTGEVPSWKKVRGLASESYQMGQVPSDVKLITLTADVQLNSIYYVARGWGARATSWLIEAGQLFGPTHEEGVWDSLADVLEQTWDGIPIRLALIDAGFRPGKKETVPVHMVYEFCRKHKRLVRPTKGASSAMVRPIQVSKIDVNVRGKIMPKALELHRLDTDHWKRWVHERLHWDPEQLGAWHLPTDVTEDYCRQVVSEARLKKPSGAVIWVQRSKDNHYFDCEAMQAAAGSLLNVSKLREGSPVRKRVEPEKAKAKPKDAGDGESWLGDGSYW